MALSLKKAENKAINEFKNTLLKHFPGQIISIFLFGSKARGEAETYSDIDLLVVLKNETLDIWDTIQSFSSDVSLKHNVLLSVKVMDTSHYNFLKQVQSGFVENVERDGANIWKAA